MFRNLPKLLDRFPTHGADTGRRSDADACRNIISARLREQRHRQSVGHSDDMFLALRGGAVIQGKLVDFSQSTGQVIVWETKRLCRMYMHVSDIVAIG